MQDYLYAAATVLVWQSGPQPKINKYLQISTKYKSLINTSLIINQALIKSTKYKHLIFKKSATSHKNIITSILHKLSNYPQINLKSNLQFWLQLELSKIRNINDTSTSTIDQPLINSRLVAVVVLAVANAQHQMFINL